MWFVFIFIKEMCFNYFSNFVLTIKLLLWGIFLRSFKFKWVWNPTSPGQVFPWAGAEAAGGELWADGASGVPEPGEGRPQAHARRPGAPAAPRRERPSQGRHGNREPAHHRRHGRQWQGETGILRMSRTTDQTEGTSVATVLLLRKLAEKYRICCFR